MTQPSTGPYGYPDRQRVKDWDGETVFVPEIGERDTAAVSSNINVSRYASLWGKVAPSSNGVGVLVELNWRAQTELTSLSPTRFIAIAPPEESPAQPLFFHVPNLAPILRIRMDAIGPLHTPWFPEAEYGLDNRQYAVETTPLQQGLITPSSILLAGGNNFYVYPRYFYAGPITMYVYCETATSQIGVEAYTTGGVWHRIGVYTAPVNEYSPVTFQVPLGSWRIVITNPTANEHTIFYGGAAAYTGAS
jgi:hypothetical protein